MMDILMLLYNTTGKGTYWRAIGFARQLVRNGHRVTLLSVSPQNRWKLRQWEEQGVRLVETPDLLPGKLRSGWDPLDIFSRIRWLRSHSFDIIHGYESRPVVIYPALAARRQTGAPLILDWADWFGQGGSVEERKNPIERGLLRPVETHFEEAYRVGANGSTVICKTLRQKALDLGVPPDHILLLPNGADVEEIKPQDRAGARERLGLPANSPLLAYTGAIFRRDAKLMSAAFREIQETRPDAKLLMIGYTNYVPDAPKGSVILTGKVTRQQLADYLSACDLGWLPLQDSGANRGRFPMKFNDFLAAGRALVATDVGDVGQVLRQEPAGLVTPAQPSALAQAALQLLEDIPSREKMEQHARQLAEQRYAWPVVTAELMRFYSCCLNRDRL